LRTTSKTDPPAANGKRAQILKQLRRQLAVKGVHGLTMRGLAASSGVATRTLFNLFGSKDALICDSLGDMDHDVHMIVMSGRKAYKNPVEQLFDYIEIASKLIRSEPGYSSAMIYAYYSADSSLISFHKYFHDFKTAMFTEILSKMRSPDELRPWVSIDLLARRIAETHIAVVAEWTRGVLRDDELVDAAGFAVATILVGHVGPVYEEHVVQKLTKFARALNSKASRKKAGKRSKVGDDKIFPSVKTLKEIL
jgi:AcrR family transcriptional regulator